jgi:hypothetical protein
VRWILLPMFFYSNLFESFAGSVAAQARFSLPHFGPDSCADSCIASADFSFCFLLMHASCRQGLKMRPIFLKITEIRRDRLGFELKNR